MSIALREIVQLPPLNQMKLLAGEKGLDKHVDKVGILDFEIIEGVKGHFGKGDFVLTTFTPVRDDQIAIQKTIQDLIACNVSCVAIKDVYVKSLTKETCEIADEAGLPIFIFKETIFFEDVMETIFEGVKSRGHLELIEGKIETLYKNDLNPYAVKAIASEINPYLKQYLVVHYIHIKSTVDPMVIAEKFRRSRQRLLSHSLLKFRDGLILILSYDQVPKQSHLDMAFILQMYSLEKKDCTIGKNNVLLEALDDGIKASVFAERVAEIEHETCCDYEDLGTYQLLMQQSEKWLIKFADRILKPIRLYDEKLIDTAVVYVEAKGDLQIVANELFQHKNTIRYRMQKIKSILNVVSDLDLYEQLTMAIRCEKLSKNKM